MTRVAIVSLGRASAKGEVRRVASWRLLFEHVGATVDEIPLFPHFGLHMDGILPTIRGRAAPERLAWSGAAARRRLATVAPDVTICVSSRAFDPSMAQHAGTLVLDFVDSLSRSYRDRARLVARVPDGLAYRALDLAHRRVEHRLRDTTSCHVAAGFSDAVRLGASWFPNLADPALVPIPAAVPDRDLLFFGTLRYPPNIDALKRLARIWRHVQRLRPGTSLLVAGAAPTAAVVEMCTANGWELVRDFDALPTVASRARVSVAPIAFTAGIQNKVLDAACLGLPQVVSNATLAGFDPGFPLRGIDDDVDFAEEAVRLLEDAASATTSAQTVAQHVREFYCAAFWTSWTSELLGPAATSTARTRR